MKLSEYYGALDEQTADDPERVVEERRAAHSDSHRARVAAIVEALEDASL